jgi:hypothetical protein
MAFNPWQRQGRDFIFLATASRPALQPTQLPIQWVMGALSVGLKWLWHVDDHLHLVQSLESMELYLHSPIFLHGVVLIKGCLHAMVLC